MSDIPKSKRAYSNLEAHHKALEIRRKIAVELLASFAYSEKKLEEAVRKQTQHIQDPEHRAEAAQAIRNLEEDFACWFIKRHRDRVDDLCCDIAQHLRGANTIWPTYHFEYNERGHPRYITSNTMVDKTVNHLLCDEVLTPSISKYLIYDNGASQKGKGVAFHRRRFEARLHQYFMQNGTNEGYILLVDFSGYYANIPHDKCLEVLQTFLEREVEDPETLAITEMLLPLIFKTFEQDVSRFTDKEIEAMMAGKIDPMLNYGVDPALLTGEKMLRKGVDIGSQPSQNIGIVYPYRLDNYAKIVKAVKGYGRYTDDSYAIARTREELLELLDGLEKEAKEYGLIINRKKTRIVKLSSEFRHLQVCYSLTETGRIIRKINPKNITRERRKLKAYKRLLDSGRIDYATVENAFKSWLGSHWKYMSHDQVYNMSSLYYELFGRRPK